MAQKRKPVRKSRNLVLGYLERISSKVFSDFPKQLTDLVSKQHGVYALYKGDQLYYVGLATNLRNRIKQHTRGKHRGKWDKFSLYLVQKADHIKELESLILRIADPKGNTIKGRLHRADNLKSRLQRQIKSAQEKQLIKLIGSKGGVKSRSSTKYPKKNTVKSKQPPLALYTKKRFKIRTTYKGESFEAFVRKDGTINYKGVIYNSPTMAGKTVFGRNVNGWYIWRYRNRKGDWARLDELRK